MSVILLPVAFAMAWEDHPDKENDHSGDKGREVCSSYDWFNRDPDSNDNNSSSHESSEQGTIPSCPDRDR